MRTRVFLALALAMLCCGTAAAQQPQPVSLISDYTVRAGKEEDFMTLVKTVGAPVRDKLMAEGVIFGWGIDVPVMRMPGQPTHSIWYTVADWASVQKVQTAMAARLAELAEQDKKAADEARKKGQKAPMSTADRIQEALDSSKTRDWLFRDIAAKFSSAAPPAGMLPFTRVYLITVKPGKATEWRAAFDKYIKPTLDQLTDQDAINGWGLGVEEVKTTNDFTHFAYVSYKDLSAVDKQRDAFVALTGKRSAEENDQIGRAFNETSDATAARSFVLRATIFKVAPPK